ncbi:MAG: 2-hydroxyacyl-CoA dehydratase [Oscillospiraceae bacterium]|nr:2-hydroxyacyl-CoA dehydratase [Oscillospiraceae bacterium]
MENIESNIAQLQEILTEFADAKKDCTLFVKNAAERGDIIIGSFCQYAPMEVINAAGMYNVLLCGFNYDPPIPLAETELPSNLCPLIKSSYGNILGKTCPFAFFSDLIVGETTCDGKKKMYEMLAELKGMHVIHLPNIPDKKRSLEAWREEILRFKEALEAQFHVEITDEKLRKAIAVQNIERSQMAQLYELGKLDPPAATGLQMRSVLVSEYFMMDKQEKIRKTERMLQLMRENWAAGKGPYAPDERPLRILVSGAGLDGVVNKTLAVIEELGAAIVCYEGCCGIMNMRRPVDESAEDPITAIAEKYLEVPCAVMSPNHSRFEQLKDTLDEWRVDGVISITVHACNPFDIESKAIGDICAEKGVPFLHVRTDYSPGDEGQIRTRLEAFIEMLESNRGR